MVVFKLPFFDSIPAKFFCISCANRSSWLCSEDTSSFVFLVYTSLAISTSLEFSQYFAAEKNQSVSSCNFFRVRQRSPKKILISFYGTPSHQPQQKISSCYSETDSLVPGQFPPLVSRYLMLFLIHICAPQPTSTAQLC